MGARDVVALRNIQTKLETQMPKASKEYGTERHIGNEVSGDIAGFIWGVVA